MSAVVASPPLPGIETALERIQSRVERFAKGDEAPFFILTGPQSAGRRTLLQRIAHHARAQQLPVFELEILPFEQATPAQVLLQIAALDPQTAEARVLSTFDSSWNERLAAADSLLNSSCVKVVLVRLPSKALPSRELPERQLQQETEDVVRLVTAPRQGKLQVVAAQPWWQRPDRADYEELRLTPSSRSHEFLSDAAIWGPLAPSAARLTALLGDGRDDLSPLQLRLGVALLQRGTAVSIVQKALARGANLRDLERPLHRLLDAGPELAAALTRVSRARTAVSAEVMQDVAAAGPDEWELLSRCFLYPEQDGRLRFHDQLRWLVADNSPEPAVHARLRRYYETLDGATDPETGLRNVVPWLEKLHHASRADTDGDVEAWLALNPPTREHFWEYGWSLSYIHKRYTAAAKVYRVLLDRIPGEDDNYGQHYYAYNLDHAGLEPIEVERYYRKAVAGDPTNPWWNSRLIGFLTERGMFEEALRAWSEALEAIDPGGDRSGGDWLPMNLHKHVIHAGLDSGNLELADAALRAIRPPAADEALFVWLRGRADAVRQVRRLGEALFPAQIDFSDWWQPRLLRQRQGEKMVGWRAGRVLHVMPSAVQVALGYRDEHGEPVLEWQELSIGQWHAAARTTEPREGDFFEYALIDGEPRLECESPGEAPMDQAQLHSHLRFLSAGSWRPR